MSRWFPRARRAAPLTRRSIVSALLINALLLVAGLARPADAQNGKGSKKTPPPDSVTAQICRIGDPSCFPRPSVTPDGLAVTVNPGTNQYVFNVRNSGGTGTLQLSASCQASSAVSGCSASQGQISLASGASTNITVTYTAASSGGTGTVTLTASGGGNSDNGSINVTVLSPPSYTVAVTPDGGSAATEPGTGLSYFFTVQNTGNQTTTYNLTSSCSGVVTNCSAPAPVTLGPGASTSAAVTYNALTRGASGTLGLTAAYSGNTAINDGGSVTINVNNSYGVNVTPDGGGQTYPAGTGLVQVNFNVQNTGTSTVTYTFSSTCRVGFTVVSGSCSPNNSSLAVAAGATTGVSVTADASMLGANFQVQLDANDAADGTHDAGTVNVAKATYTVSLSPHGDQHASDAGLRDSIGFSIQDVGNTSTTYTLAPACTGSGVQGCAGPASIALNPGVPTTVYVTYTAGSAGATGTVSLVATGGSGSSFTKDSAYVGVTVSSHTVAVTPDGATPPAIPGGTGLSYSFTVQNTGNQAATYNLTASCSGVVTSCSAQGSVTVNPGPGTPVSVTYNAVPAGTGTLTLTATYSGNSGVHDNGSVTITVDPPHPFAITVALSNSHPSVGATVTATATVTDQYNATMPSQSVTWTSSATNVATVTSTGALTANVNTFAVGSSTITAAAGGKSGFAVVSPGDGTITAIVLGMSQSGAIDRGGCLTIAVSDAAAYECGDLRIVHALPTTTTMNKPRTPTLIYSSSHAVPGTAIVVDVTDAGNSPTKIQAAVTISLAGGTQLPLPVIEKSWNPACANQVCRMVIPVTGLSQGAYDFTLDVNAITGTAPVATTRYLGVVTIVDRSKSLFGAGWWLDGLERLVPVVNHDDRLLWIGGDGSTRVYVKTSNPSIWTVQPTIDRPDTLEQVGSVWRRHMRNGAYVEFDNLYRHSVTVNSRGWKTQFCYTSTTDTVLQKITLPLPTGTDANCASGPTYTFAYDNDQNNKPRILQSVTAPPNLSNGESIERKSVITPRAPASASDYFISAIKDLETVATSQVSFESNTIVPNLISARINRMSARTEFAYDGTFNKLIRVDRFNSYNAPQFTPTQITSYFCPAEIRTDASCTRGSGTVNALGLELSSKDSTIFDGPRTGVVDVTKFLIDGWGAPTTIVDAKGAVTVLKRTDSRFPTLVTEVDYPNARTTTAVYTDRGLIQYSTDDAAADVTGVPGDVARTDYTWHASYDLLLGITTPLKVSTKFDYYLNAAEPWRFRARKLQYDSVKGPGAATTYDYYTTTDGFSGLAKSSTLPPRSASIPGTATETYAYDDLGNLMETVGPSPDHVEHWFLRDAIGRLVADSVQLERVTPASNSVWKVKSFLYDDLDRVLNTSDAGPERGVYAAIASSATTNYDAEGRPLDVTRGGGGIPAAPGLLKTKWTYDLLGRRITEETQDVDANNQLTFLADTTMYDEAGNVRYHRSRRQLKTSFAYDELNRMTSRVADPHTYLQEFKGAADPARGVEGPAADPYPYYPNNAVQGYDIYQDNASFAYDPQTGTLTDANNGYALIHRDYYKNGMVKDEVLKIANWAGAGGATPTFGHTYTTAYGYDKDGRQTTITYPDVLAAGSTQNAVHYDYDRSGALYHITDLLNKQFTFSYNWRDERTELRLPGGGLDSLSFDDEGNLARHSVRSSFALNTAADIREETFSQYDAQGKLVLSQDIRRLKAQNFSVYDGLGQLRYNDYQTAYTPNGPINESVNRYTLDGLGNLTKTDGNDILNWGNQSIPNGSPGITQSYFNSISGRLTATDYQLPSMTVTHYDSSGNVEWTTDSLNNTGLDQNDRRAYYGADEMLRAVDARHFKDSDHSYDRTFEEYWYDALRRRVLVRSRRFCSGEMIPQQGPNGECAINSIRRVIWDGAQELGEIQMPGGDADNLENDTQISFQQSVVSGSLTDANHFFGISSYTFGNGIDQPLSVMRKGYSDGRSLSSYYAFQNAFDIIPLWNDRGAMDGALYNDGAATYSETAPDGTVRRDSLDTPAAWYAYARPRFAPSGWHGSLLSDKADNSGLLYRRNRYYDPSTGRFTQEDPMGLAGGLNLYGFAAGDPQNYADPFGLCPIERDGKPCGGTGVAVGAAVGFAAGALASVACAVATEGGCAVVAPEIVGYATGLGSAIGGAIGTYLDLEHSEDDHATTPPPQSKPTPGDIADAVDQAGGKVTPHRTKTGEGATIKWPDGSHTDIRVESHPLPGSQGHPVPHGNVDTNDGKRIKKKHIYR
jgi:RHS repeat-associated protein